MLDNDLIIFWEQNDRLAAILNLSNFVILL